MSEWEVSYFTAAFIGYFIASCFYIGRLVWIDDRLEKAGRVFCWAGIAANAAAVAARTAAAGRLPFANMYEFGLVLVLGMMLLYVAIEWRSKKPALGAFLLPLAFLLAGAFSLFYQEARPLMPALKSNWLLAHVAAAVVAYGALGASCAASAVYLWRRKLELAAEDGPIMGLIPELGALDLLSERLIALALPFLTVLIITGAVWAEYAWGSYWRWDPKETWSLITWLIYAAYLHGRAVLGWRGDKAARWAIAGFIAVLITFIGVNMLLPGLHSYAF